MTPSNSPETVEASTDLRKGRRRIILAWVWVLCWGALIWTLGGDSFSFTETNDHIMPWLDWLTGNLDYRTRYRIFVAIRKSAHFIEYAVLALLTFRAAMLAAERAQLAAAGWIALFIVSLMAGADEVRQSFSSVRTGSPYDVLIDVAGGLIAIAGVIVISRRLRAPASLESSAQFESGS